MRIVIHKKILLSTIVFMFVLLSLPLSSKAAECPTTGPISVTNYLKNCTVKPLYKNGHSMPRLSTWQYSGSGPLEFRKELADEFNFAFSLGVDPIAALDRYNHPNPANSYIMDAHDSYELAKLNPEKYPIQVHIWGSSNLEAELRYPESLWAHSLKGFPLRSKTEYWRIWGTEQPDSNMMIVSEERAYAFRAVSKDLNIAIATYNGELNGNPSFDSKYGLPWSGDPKSVAAKGNSTWTEYFRDQWYKEKMLTIRAVREAIPNRQLLVYYGNPISYKNLNSFDVIMQERYYKYGSFGSTWDQGFSGRMATYRTMKSLSPVEPIFYDIVSPGLMHQPVDNVINWNWISDMARYTGFLKQMFMSGSLGATTYWDAVWAPEANGTLDANKSSEHYKDFVSKDDPRNFFDNQFVQISQVQAEFSYFEDIIRHGELLPGPNNTYEFPTGNADTHVLVRKRTGQSKWLISAWTTTVGVSRNITVAIPGIGNISLNAINAGHTYFHNGDSLYLADGANPESPSIDLAAEYAKTNHGNLAGL